MMTAMRLKEKEKAVNRLDSTMTPAQVARRKFKSSLPRKVENRRLSAEAALGETFTLLDRFRGIVTAEMHDPEAVKTVYAALAYCLPESKPAMLADTLPVPEPGMKKAFGAFCEKALSLDKPHFLGVVFVQVDPHAENRAYKAVSFVTQFMSGPDAEARLHYAQEKELLKIQKDLEKRIFGLSN
jgi:hypothetical protein